MSIIPNQNKPIRENYRSNWLDDNAMSILLKKLENIQTGLLQVYANGMLYEFGNTNTKSEINAVIRIQDNRVFRAILTGGEPAAGKTYIDGWWTSDDLIEVLRIFTINRNALFGFKHGIASLAKTINRFSNNILRNTLKGSKRNIKAHYDIGNDLYELFLDENMMYSSAYFRNDSEDLSSASKYKLKLICEKLNLQASDNVIEIGTGWGGFAIYAAQNYGCHVTTTTISDQQFDHAKAKVDSLNLSERISVIKQDYRALSGSYDKLVSIEMIESVGHQYIDEYFSVCNKLLKPSGAMLIQSITMSDYLFKNYVSSTDFIRKYVFPGGCLTSMSSMMSSISKHTDLTLYHSESFASSYAKTLKIWHQNFYSNRDKIIELGYSTSFLRLWEYYMKYCQAGFENRIIDVHHLVLKKPNNRFNHLSA
ncbi:MAG: cyclopropane-fatty-acyl-phospholipid synthase family protein [Gammaproteobacteria bacterium]|nr:cyclopropane-fatty-acyl-phospholipid synthase family protein [Gammaproteobacteria bacterium]